MPRLRRTRLDQLHAALMQQHSTRLVCLHVAAPSPRIVLNLPSRGVEGIMNRQVCIAMLGRWFRTLRVLRFFVVAQSRMRRGVMTHNDVTPRYGQIDFDAGSIPGPMVMMRQGDDDMTSKDIGTERLELLRAVANVRFDAVRL
jgi:hypothetical protein